jgi:SPFH domain / Band 7 family
MIAVIALLCWAAICGLAIYALNRGKPTWVTLLEYQRGILYRRGLPIQEVGRGKHRVWSGTELLVHADIRPISINFENQVVALQDGSSALYGFAASAQIQDIRKVIYAARDYNHVPPATLLRCARLHLSTATQSSLAVGKDAIAAKIAEDARTRLRSVGFDLVSFRLSQLAIGTVKKQEEPPKKEASTLV